MSTEYTLIRNFRGSWPDWFADLDDGRFVYIRIRHGYVFVGVGATQELAMGASEEVKSSPDYAGVSDAVDALVILREQGYYYVSPNA